jgi:hypothetical protein
MGYARLRHRLLSIPSSRMAAAIRLKKGQFAFPGFKVKRSRTTPRHRNNAARDGRLYTAYR